MEKNSGIYKITNMVNEKFYIGSAVCFQKRWWVHKSTLIRQTHKNSHLQNAWNLYGEENFKFEIIEIVDDVGKLIEREQYWLEKMEAVKNGYNKNPTAGSGLGTKLSDESKEKIRQRALGRKHSQEARRKMSLQRKGESNVMYGKNHTEKSKEKMKYLKDGTLRSEAISGENNHFYGKKHDDETKKKISQANMGRIVTENERQYKSELFSGENNPFYGKKHTEETKTKLKESFTEDRRKNLSQKMKLNNPNKDGNLSKKKVSMLDLATNEILMTFESLLQAGNYLIENNITTAKHPSTSIVNYIKGRQNTAYGYKWKYEE